MIVVAACGGTTGREGLQLPETPAPSDAASAGTAETGITNGDDDATVASIDGDTTESSSSDDASAQSADAPADAVAPLDATACCTVTPTCVACLMLNGCADPNLHPCSDVQGTATDGPAAGQPRSDLCKAVYACVTQTNCAPVGNSATACYCGTAQGADCLNPGAANGACKTAIENGLETNDPATIATGFANPNLAGGIALAFIQCAHDNCPVECGANDGGAPDGS